MAGRRTSASIRMTVAPDHASETARLIAVVVFPSHCPAPVTRIEQGRVERVATSVARSVRYASSPTGLSILGLRGRVCLSRRRCTSSPTTGRRVMVRITPPRAARSRGILARTGRWNSRRSCSSRWRRGSIPSRANAATIPIRRPLTIATARLSAFRGDDGAVGGCATVATRMSGNGPERSVFS